METRGLTLSFGGLRALDDVSIEVAGSETVGIIGPNGAGKTTLFNAITGVHEPTDGTVTFDGLDIAGFDTSRRAALGIGRTFQNLGLMMEETALTNVMAAQHLSASYGFSHIGTNPMRIRRVEQKLADQAMAWLRRFGMNREAEQPVASLSFAGARFVELACVLSREPKILLLDEPTTGLDVGERETLRTVLRELQDAGHTIVFIAHDVGFVMDLCDRVYVLARGSVLREGVPEEIQRDEAVIEAYLGSGRGAAA